MSRDRDRGDHRKFVMNWIGRIEEDMRDMDVRLLDGNFHSLDNVRSGGDFGTNKIRDCRLN